MMVSDDGLIIIDPPESVEYGEECLAAFRRVVVKPVKAIVYTHNHFDHVAWVKAFTTEEDVQKFFRYFDRPVHVGSINLIVR